MNSNTKLHVGPNQFVAYDVKQRESEELANHLAEFQARGGKIEVLGTTPRRDIHDYKKAEKGRKGGRKNKKEALSAVFLSKKPKFDILDEQDNVPLDEVDVDNALEEA